MIEDSTPESGRTKQFLLDNDIDPDVYEAYLHGLNVGIEVGKTGRWDDMDEEEIYEYQRQMFMERTDG